MVEVRGPLNPDPFEKYESPDSNLARWRYFENGGRSRWLSTQTSSLACVAFIPKGELKGLPSVFDDDGVVNQPCWLSETMPNNNFRFVHGLRMNSSLKSHGLPSPPNLTVILETNPTTIRPVPIPPISPEVESSEEPGMKVLPPSRPSTGPPFVVGMSSARARNGFLVRPIVSLRKMARRLRRKEKKALPERIGSSLQVWHARNGCKCVSLLHNYFPRYRYYIDGVKVDYPHETDFEDFDGFEIDVEWKVHMAYRMHGAIIPYYPPKDYPGGMLVGWYKSVDSKGNFDWCEKNSEMYYVKFPYRSGEEREEWWNNLTELVEDMESARTEIVEETDSERVEVRIGEDEWKQKMKTIFHAPSEERWGDLLSDVKASRISSNLN